ncbi:MAG: hypothetical protein QY328_10530 [Anaerolineales bacterium]|nr:MAG: hypothetical protein QY328_10530 [Anaerolineales bacterium]
MNVIPDKRLRLTLFVVLMLAGFGIAFRPSNRLAVHAQQPTGSVPTVTGTAAGMIVAVNLDINIVNVYAGPSSYLYPTVGVLLKGQEVPAFGISEDGNWIQIYYPGVPDSVAWIYGPYVNIKRQGPLPVLRSPATPTPLSTPTLNPTLEAAFIPPVTPTRLPTFTPPAPLIIATFLPDQSAVNRVPAGLIIFGLGFIGALGTLISFLRGR